MNIAIVIKTSLDYDGRVISQIDALASKYPENQISILLLPDKKTTINFANNVSIKEINLVSRRLPKSAFWQFFKMVEFGITITTKLFQINPKIIHVHDENSILGPLLFKKLKHNVLLIYDDHELKNLPPKNVKERLMLRLEKSIFKLANVSIVANENRKRFISKIFNPQNCYVIENWLYNREVKQPEQHTIELLKVISNFKKKGYKIILHQGILNEDRSVDLVKTIVTQLPDNWVMLFIGVRNSTFNSYLSNNLNAYFGGFVTNPDLHRIWNKMDAVVVFYSTNSLNNKYCAPNRFYLALNWGIPVIINENNPELYSLIQKHKVGVAVSSNNVKEKIASFFSNYHQFKNEAASNNGCFEYKMEKHPVLSIYEKLIINIDH